MLFIDGDSCKREKTVDKECSGIGKDKTFVIPPRGSQTDLKASELVYHLRLDPLT